VWTPNCHINDQVQNTCIDMGFNCSASQSLGHTAPPECHDSRLEQLTHDYQKNMAALRTATLDAGKFAWQMLWTGGSDASIGGGSLTPLVTYRNCAQKLRSMCSMDSPAQTRAMAYGLNGTSAHPSDVRNDLTNFLLTRGPFSWLGWGWENAPEFQCWHSRTRPGCDQHGKLLPPRENDTAGCSRVYTFPEEFNVDYGQPAAGAAGLCKESAPGSQIFVREYSKATVQMDCRVFMGTIRMK
jgi:hypothetical protein